jgi:glycosyltransferase involved in cell wall biosynthesis
MKVVLAHNRYRLAGGEERHVDLLANALSSSGIEVERFEKDSATIARRFLPKLKVATGLAYRPAVHREFSRWLDDNGADVVHFHNIWPLLTPAALRAAKTRARVALTVHNYRFACAAGTLLSRNRTHDVCIDRSSLACALRNPRGSWSESLAYGLALEVQRRASMLERWTDVLVTPSAFAAGVLIRAGISARRIEVVPHGTPEPTHAREGRDFALYVGRLSPEKGVETLLSATRLSGTPLVVVGEGELAERCSGIDGVRFLGPQTQTQLASLRARAAFAVVPSECFEVLSLAAIEALAAGLPVIATRTGGLPEVVDDGVTGLLVEAGDPGALACAMRCLMRDRDRVSEMGERAREVAARRFSLAEQTSRLIELYRAVDA